jgi:hypothetical protein
VGTTVNLQKRPADFTEVRLLSEDDAPAMRKLFREVFGEQMSQAFWDWKYRLNDGHAVGAFRGMHMIGHYGGVGVDIRYFGKPARAIQIVDVMIRPSARQAVRKSSPFFLTGSQFLGRFIGYDNPYLLGYGFPSDRHMRLAAHLGLYADVGHMLELNWPLQGVSVKADLWHKEVALTRENFSKLKPALQTLWQQQAQELANEIVVQKNPAWIQRRYLLNPERQYGCYLLCNRLGGKALGLIVLKTENERMLLMDMIGSRAHFPLLLQLAASKTIQAGKQRLSTWCSEAFIDCFRVMGPQVTRLPITTPANTWTAGPQPDELRNHWWLMPGDTDFL